MCASANLRSIDVRNSLAIPFFAVTVAISAFGQIKTLKPGWNLFSPQQDIQLGKEAVAQVQQKMPVVHNPEVDAYLNSMLDRLKQSQHAGKLTGTNFPFTINLISDKNINAFALPGGPLFIHSALILAADNEAQLAGVIGHEMSHIVLRHSTNQMSKQNLLQIPAALAGAVGGNGMLGQLEKAGVGLFANGLALKFSRTDESQADYNGALIVAEAGYNPLEMAHFFEKLEAQAGKQGAVAQLLSDHPNPGNRVKAVEDEIRSMPQQAYATDSGQFQRIKQIVSQLPAAKALSGGPASAANVPSVRPSGRLREYKGSAFSLSYPDNWQVFGDQQSNMVTIAPKEGVLQGQNGAAVGYGLEVSYFFPQGDTIEINNDTKALVQLLTQQNQGLKVTSQPLPTQIGGQRGLVTVLAGKSPFQGETEVDTLLTVARPEGLFYIVFIAPQSEHAQIEEAIREVLGTVRFQN